MSVTIGATIWTNSCDRQHCATQTSVVASCSQAFIDAEQSDWQARYSRLALYLTKRESDHPCTRSKP